MSIRQPRLEPPKLDMNETVLKWHSMSCELVTPLYGGGVESTVVDTKMPIRAASIRGQLRFWWRILAKNKWKLGDSKAIRKAEFELWGGMGDQGQGQAGQVFLKVSDFPSSHEIKNKLMPYKKIKLPYVLFPAANAKNSDKYPHKLLREKGITWRLSFAFGQLLQVDQTRQQHVIETLQWWSNFGGLGFRSRKGLGAVHVSICESFPQITQILTAEDVKQAGCQLAQRASTQTDAFATLQTTVSKLSDFRQASNLGRNPGKQSNCPGRSRWPEPDAMRRIQNTHAPEHAPEHPAGNIFPRGMFGLPIILHFVGRGEPRDENIIPAQGERLASPLILRPVYAGEQNGKKQWKASALLLPHEHVLTMSVKMKAKDQYPIWKPEAAALIRPIAENGGGNPLQAFLTYFAK